MEENKNESVVREAREKTVGFVTAALGFVAGLAWNDAVQSLINRYIELDQNSVGAKFLYALGVTIVAVVVITYLERLSRRRS